MDATEHFKEVDTLMKDIMTAYDNWNCEHQIGESVLVAERDFHSICCPENIKLLIDYICYLRMKASK
jgi:hypothetical protein